MRKSLFIFFVILFVFSCDNNDKSTIKGSYPEGSGKKIKLELLNGTDVRVIDSTRIRNNGTFKFQFDLPDPELLLLKNEAGKHINLIVYPYDKIFIKISGNSFTSGYTVSGSTESNKIRNLVLAAERTRFQLDSILLELETESDTIRAKVLTNAYQKIYLEHKRQNIRFVVENINSLSSVYALYQKISPELPVFNEIRDLQYFKIVADSLQVAYPNSTLTNSLVTDINTRLMQYNTMMTLKTLSSENKVFEKGYIDLQLPDTEGKKVTLSSLQNKVILLTFWASWNSESMEAVRRLKSIYEKYHNKGFEIYSVSLDKQKETWIRAIHFDELPGINVSELSYPESYAARVYNISSLPTNFLIDKEGNIVAINIYGKKLATWLDNLL